MNVSPEQPTRSVGAQIPEDLYWKFVQARADRHETAAKALEIAIMLYASPLTSVMCSKNFCPFIYLFWVTLNSF